MNRKFNEKLSRLRCVISQIESMEGKQNDIKKKRLAFSLCVVISLAQGIDT